MDVKLEEEYEFESVTVEIPNYVDEKSELSEQLDTAARSDLPFQAYKSSEYEESEETNEIFVKSELVESCIASKN